MSARIDLTGRRFGMLVVIGFSRSIRIDHPSRSALYPHWNCVCDCGQSKEANGQSLKGGIVNSCGCLAGVRHGMTETDIYKIWTGMLTRCFNPNCPAYKWYGARGVVVCDEWRGSFPAFLSYIGARPSKKHSVDRFPDNAGNYEPGNVRWATPHQQRMNQRRMKRAA